MHEMGLLAKMMDIVEETARENDIKHIDAISVEIGELSGVLPYFLEQYYPMVIEGNPLFEGSEIRIKEIPGQGLCTDCNAIYNIQRFDGICPRCKSRNKKVLGGQDFKLKEIIVREEQ